MPFLRSRIGRAALTLVLLLTTQFAMAGQVCRSAMGGAPDGCPLQVRGEAAHSMSAAMDSPACCGTNLMPATPCLIALGDLSLAAMAPGSAHLLDLALPSRDYSMTASAGASSVSVLLPTASVGPPLPAYIVFHRFLS